LNDYVVYLLIILLSAVDSVSLLHCFRNVVSPSSDAHHMAIAFTGLV